MICLCGDTHGEIDLYKVEDYFEEISINENVTKDDYLIILGDAAACFDGGRGDDYVRERLHNLPCTVLWLDGNHENFDCIEEYPVEEWKGGKVQFITEDIIHLMRGQVFEIEGKNFFTFGGGYSIDKYMRSPHISWWPQEMPNEEEYKEGIRNLERVGNKVDYVLTHTCPEFIATQLVSDIIEGEEDIRYYFDDISQSIDFDMWYFGHWHMDESIDNYRCLWYDIIKL